jgi:glycosyltransferase involved in cell wall biosynthesis
MSSATPDVSVVIATYNMGRFLGAAIDSVLNQTAGCVEVHVVDDGSTDNTRQIVDAYRLESRVYYHWQENAGQTRAKNVGVRAARGRYIGFCDADDLWSANKLALQLPVLEANPHVAVVYTRVQPIDVNGRLLATQRYAEHSGHITEQLFIENFIPFGTALVRRSAMEQVGGFDEALRMGIDWDLWLRLSVPFEFLCLPEETYFYRVWEGQMSKNWRGRFEAAFDIMERFEKRYPGRIPAAVRRRAYWISHLNRAHARARISNDRRGAMADCWRALVGGAELIPVAKTAAKLLLRHPYQ